MTVARGTSWLALCLLLTLHAWMVTERAIGQPAILHFIEVNDAKNPEDKLTSKTTLPRCGGYPPSYAPTGQTCNEFKGLNRLVHETSIKTSELIENVRNARFGEVRMRLTSDLVDDSGFDCPQAPWVLDALPFRAERQVARAWIEEQLYRCSLELETSP